MVGNDLEYTSNLAVDKVRSLLKKIKKSEQMQIKFKNCCETAGITATAPIIDVRTRWYSTFEMLNWAHRYRL